MSVGDMQPDTHAWAPIADVATAYGVSIDTIRRRMRKGEIEGRREQTPQGFRWLAQLPKSDEHQHSPNVPEASESAGNVQYDLDIVRHDQEELISTLRHELALRNREISRLHEVVANQALALQHQTQTLAASISSAAAPPSEIFDTSADVSKKELASVATVTPPVAKPSSGAWDRFIGFLRGTPNK